MEGNAAPSKLRTWLLCATFGIGLLGLGLRVLPICLFDAGPTGWKTWTKLFPNLACSLDLSEQAGSLSPEELSERLDDFSNLQSLNLSKSGLTEVPASIVTLKELTWLSLAGNELTTLPTEMSGIVALAYLDISGNSLSSLPGSLGTLSGLTTLNVSNNELQQLPSSLTQAPIEEINVGSNPLSEETEEDIEEQFPDVEIDFGTSSSSSSAAPTSSHSSVSAGGTSSSAITTPASSSAPTTISSSTSSHASSVAAVISSSASSSSSSTEVSAASSSSSSEASSDPPPPPCTKNFSINGYSFCLPAAWTADSEESAANLLENGVIVARVECPLHQENYDDWDLSIRSRTYLKSETKYGADLWTGTAKETSGTDLLMVFMHKNDFNSWYGNDYQDVGASCQVVSLAPGAHQNIFRTLYFSVE